jgi:hypothetical protein
MTPCLRHLRAGLVIASSIASLFFASVWSAVALADGDPASDVLGSQPLFLPQDAAGAPKQQAELSELLASAANSGYSVRVALIASRSDLGSVTALWQHPQSYADFLAQELALTYKGPLLVVMPGGYGLHRPGAGAGPEIAALRRLPPPARPLSSAALNAVQHVAAASGHQLPVPSASAPERTAPLGPVSWLALTIGVALVAAAWIASLRARPLRRSVNA